MASVRTQPSAWSSGSCRAGSGRAASRTARSASPTVNIEVDPSPDKVFEQLRPFESQEAFRVELDTFEGKSLVANPHDLVLVGPGDQVELGAERAGLNDQAVIPRGLERVAQAPIDPLLIVVDHRGLAVHDPVGPDNFAAEDMADALVAQADSQ